MCFQKVPGMFRSSPACFHHARLFLKLPGILENARHFQNCMAFLETPPVFLAALRGSLKDTSGLQVGMAAGDFRETRNGMRADLRKPQLRAAVQACLDARVLDDGLRGELAKKKKKKKAHEVKVFT